MKKSVSILLALGVLLTLLSGCSRRSELPREAAAETFSDDAGRTVAVPKDITRVAASGATAQMILMTLAPELLVGLASAPSEAQRPYLPGELWELPVFGQFYGSRANLNLESLIAARPQLIIDLGDKKGTISEDMNMIQEQTNIPTVFLEATLTALPETYRRLGALLNRQEQGERLASFVEETLAMAAENAAQIPAEERKTVLFGTGATGLACNAEGSVQADVLVQVGAVNAVKTGEVTNRGGGTQVNLEEVYRLNPDVILLSAGGPYDELSDSEWAELSAVRRGAYYEIPGLPYDWMSSPPSVNRVLGIWWLGNLLYPQVYDYDMVEKAREFYQLFWHYPLSAQEAESLLARSTLR